MKNIVLIGMMGCGKTTCGRRLARRLGRELCDTDELIAAREGRSIPELFAREGEDYFRAREGETARALAGREDLVIACGGGLPTRAEAIAPLKESGIVFFLNRDPEEIYDTVSMADRPLGQGGRAAFLERYRRREPIYRRWADYLIPSRTPQEAERLIATIYCEECLP